MKSSKITIDIISDVACPWCYVGKKHLEQALEKIDNSNIEINWRPFELDATIPAEGYERDVYFAKKFGDMSRFKSMTDRLVEVGENAGIKFDFEGMTAAIRTLPLHQLLHFASKEGFGDKLKEAFLKAFFENGVDLRKIENLVTILKPFGWNQEKIESIMADDMIAKMVTQEIQHFQSLGVSGVPFFIFNNKYGVSGAQPPATFLDIIAKLDEEEKPELVEGETCDPETKNC